MADKEKTDKETEEKKTKAREVALKNLKSQTLTSFATAYFVKHSDGKYGSAVSSAVEEFQYRPALKGKEGSELLAQELLNSRQDGEEYTGSVSEGKVIGDCAKIVQESLLSIKPQDVLALVGSDKKPRGEYDSNYLFDLAGAEDKKKKELAAQIVGSYIAYLIDAKVSEALAARKKSNAAGLEKLLTEPEKKKEQPKPAEAEEEAEAA